MFNNRNIRKRVLAHVETRIAEGQAEYDKGAEREDQQLSEGVIALTDACRRNKATLEESIITKIIG